MGRVILRLVRIARAAASLLLLAACSQGRLQGGAGKLVAPASVDFGNVYAGATAVKQLSLANAGDAQLALDAVVKGDPQLSLGSSVSFTVPPGASATLSIVLAAAQPGSVSATLSIAGDATAVIPVSAQVVADLPCPESTPCSVQTFDPNRGACVGSPSPDGAPCNDGNQCETAERCIGGVCKGTAASCDDHDVCTADYCTPAQGCQHLDQSASCQGENPCEIYFCDPVKGCQSTPATDGTPCNAAIQCQQASVCFHGQCIGTPLPDGTPCIPPADPCVGDATCRSGVCHSPTADALVPGDILWKVVASELSDGDGGEIAFEPLPDAGPPGYWNVPGWRAAAAVDSAGNLYLDHDDLDGGGAFVSLDVCGRQRWSTNEWGRSSSQWTNGRHLLIGDRIVVTVADDQSFLAQSTVTGQLLWSFDLSQAGFNLAALNGFTVQDIALSNDGTFYFTADWTEPDGDGGTLLYGLVGGLLANGQLKFTAVQPAVEELGGWWPGFGYPLLVDANEQLYTVLQPGNRQDAIVSYDQTGAPRWALPVPRDSLRSLSDFNGVFLEPTSMTAFDSNGRVVWSDTQSADLVLANGHSPVVEPDGTELVACQRFYGDGGGYGSIESYAAGGAAGWKFALGDDEWPQSSEVLDGQGTLYFASTARRLVALNGTTGSQEWQLDLPSEGPMYPGVLALTPASSLIVSARRELFSVYAGAQMSASPWPRFRGDNLNRSCPAPQGPGGSPPSP